MRTEVLDYIRTVDLGGFSVTETLPWSESGTPLYIKNVKTIYVDAVQYTTEPFLSTLNSLSLQNEVQTVRVFFASDAKTLLPNYNDLITELRLVNNIVTVPGVHQRQVDISTTMQNDLLITELEYRFTKLLR